jgi:hypothetical protein
MEQIMKYLDEAENNYFKLLVIPEDCKEKNDIIRFLEDQGWKRLDITKEVFRIEKDIPRDKEKLRTSIELENWLSNLSGDKYIFENIEILFSPELGKIDPIRLFKYRFCRERIAILIFPGRIKGEKAEYSLEGREDHMIMDVSEVICYPTKGSE